VSASPTVRGRKSCLLALVTALGLSGLLTAGAEPPPGRPPVIAGRGDLAFNDVVAGIPASVPRQDRQHAGTWSIRGAANEAVLLTLSLPPALDGPSGARLPLVFGPDDAGYAHQQHAEKADGFDPRGPHLDQLSGSGHGWVFLGGTVRPAIGQRAGAYRGTVVLTVSYVTH
jgi:hypothetical protein